MDFNDTTEEAEFRTEARNFLAQHLEPKGAKPLRQRVSGEEFMKQVFPRLFSPHRPGVAFPATPLSP